ncbi:MAG: matrixin family metalloprotease [Armatimonas sp.]
MKSRALFVSLPVALLLSGCGSGVFVKTVTRPAETGPIPRAQAVPAAPYTPNYRTNLRDGFSWAKSELTVYLDSTDTTQKNTVLEGARQWSAYPGSTFTFREVSSPDQADIKVTFKPAIAFSDDSAGLTTVYPESTSNDLVTAEVEIRNDVTGAELLTLSAHEFGHALGIDGHSTATSDCMNPYAPNPARITQPDANTLALIYDTNSRARAARGRKAVQIGTPVTITCGH